jgi:hypothetical protein
MNNKLTMVERDLLYHKELEATPIRHPYILSFWFEHSCVEFLISGVDLIHIPDSDQQQDIHQGIKLFIKQRDWYHQRMDRAMASQIEYHIRSVMLDQYEMTLSHLSFLHHLKEIRYLQRRPDDDARTRIENKSSQ